MKSYVVILGIITCSQAFASPYPVAGGGAILSSLLSWLAGAMFLLMILTFLFRGAARTLKNPLDGFIYTFIKVYPWAGWVAIPLAVNTYLPMVTGLWWAVPLLGNAWLSFKLLDLGERLYPEDE